MFVWSFAFCLAQNELFQEKSVVLMQGCCITQYIIIKCSVSSLCLAFKSIGNFFLMSIILYREMQYLFSIAIPVLWDQTNYTILIKNLWDVNQILPFFSIKKDEKMPHKYANSAAKSISPIWTFDETYW